MKWSQLKKLVEGRFADSVRGRVEIWMTKYHKVHNREGEFRITIDKKRVYYTGGYLYEVALCEALCTFDPSYGTPHYSVPSNTWRDILPKAEKMVHQRGIMTEWDVETDLYSYLSMQIEEILISDSFPIQALGMLDKRLGKRRLATLSMENKHPLVKTLYEFRCSVEKVPV